MLFYIAVVVYTPALALEQVPSYLDNFGYLIFIFTDSWSECWRVLCYHVHCLCVLHIVGWDEGRGVDRCFSGKFAYLSLSKQFEFCFSSFSCLSLPSLFWFWQHQMQEAWVQSLTEITKMEEFNFLTWALIHESATHSGGLHLHMVSCG